MLSIQSLAGHPVLKSLLFHFSRRPELLGSLITSTVGGGACVRFGAWVLVPLQGAVARRVAVCALELGCFAAWVLVPLVGVAAGWCYERFMAVCALEPACWCCCRVLLLWCCPPNFFFRYLKSMLVYIVSFSCAVAQTLFVTNGTSVMGTHSTCSYWRMYLSEFDNILIASQTLAKRQVRKRNQTNL